MRQLEQPHRNLSGPVLRTLRAFTLGLSFSLVCGSALADPDAAHLRVCADPNNMPLSDDAGNGYENRIAQLIADELKLPLQYTYLPQRMGFIRNTLRASDGQGGYKCDLVIGVPSDYEMTSNTRPYLHSMWVMVLPDRPEFAGLKSPDDLLTLPPEVLHKLKLGTFTHSPPLDWVFEHKLFDQAVIYQAMAADPKVTPGQVVSQDLVDGKIDVALVWGPIGAYYAKRSGRAFRVLPFVSDKKLRYDYVLAMGVRVPEKQWAARVDAVIAKRQADIDRILKEFDVPLMDLPAPAAAGDDRK